MTWHQRMAVQLVLKLPDERGDAILILKEMQTLLDYLFGQDAIKPTVVDFSQPRKD